MLAACQTTVMDLLREIDETCSRFRADSEISVLNASAGTEVRVSPLLARALDEALRAAHMTNGDVDPTVGAAMDAIGYDVDFARIADDGAASRFTAGNRGTWRSIELEVERRMARVPEGVRVDLGATAKALAADLAAEAAIALVFALATSGTYT
jgi:thiamine biosynthesis lipoprotein